MTYAEIVGWGKCVPPAALSNDDLATFLDTSDEWIQSRTGIRERRITHVQLSDLATVAAKQALAAAGIKGSDIDLVILGTASGDDAIPNTASLVQRNIGANKAAAFDVNAACSGFLYGLNIGTSMIKSGAHQKVLVIGADRLTWYLDWMQRDVCVLFGDGAGAVVLEVTDQPLGQIAARTGCSPEAREILEIHNFGTDMQRFGNNGIFPIAFEGQEIFKRAIKGMGEASENALADAGLSGEDVNLIIPHQANLRIIQTLAKKMGAPMEKVMVNVERYGNTSAASVPIALCEALEQGRVKPGDRLLSAAFGAGLTWAASVIKWGQRVSPVGTSDATLPPCDKSALELLEPLIQGSQNAPR